MTPEAALLYLYSSLYGMPVTAHHLFHRRRQHYLYCHLAAQPESRSNLEISFVRHGLASAISLEAQVIDVFQDAALYRIISKNQ
jgi:hypothetical protein